MWWRKGRAGDAMASKAAKVMEYQDQAPRSCAVECAKRMANFALV